MLMGTYMRKAFLVVGASWWGLAAAAQSTSPPPATSPTIDPPRVQQVHESNAASTADAGGGWRFQILPYVWVPEVHGDVGADGASSGVDLGLGDAFGLAYAVPAHIEVSHGDLTLFTDLLYFKFKGERSGPLGGDLTSSAEGTVAEIGAAYRVYDSARDHQGSSRWTIEPLLGIRYYQVSVGLETETRSIDESARQDWVDGVAGARVGFSPSASWRLGIRGDVAAGSSFTWNVIGSVEWSVADWFSLVGGYRIFDIDYSSGSGSDEFALDVQLRGPFLAAAFTF